MAKSRSRSLGGNRRSKFDWEFIARILRCASVRVLYLFGPPGIGKTWSAYHIGRLERGVYSITLTDDTPAAELRGHWILRGREAVWLDGPFVRAMREGARLVLNELSHASSDVLALLHPVLESPGTAQLTLPTGETVRPAPGFHVVATDNASPESLPLALQDRFGCRLEILEPHPDALAKLSPALWRAAQRTFDLEPERSVSVRAWLQVEELQHELDLHHACLAVFGIERGEQIHDAILLAESQTEMEF